MTSRAKLATALRIAREGPPSRARANKFGWSEADFLRHKRLWEWAMHILERRSCGARRRRDGKPCQALNEPGRTRCRWHGGRSTGPRTAAGKVRALENLRQYRAAAQVAMDPSPHTVKTQK